MNMAENRDLVTAAHVQRFTTTSSSQTNRYGFHINKRKKGGGIKINQRSG
jgi:hypothetical protein